MHVHKCCDAAAYVSNAAHHSHTDVYQSIVQGELQHAVDLERSRTAEASAAAEAAAEKAATARQEGEAARFALRSWQEAESASTQQQVRSTSKSCAHDVLKF